MRKLSCIAVLFGILACAGAAAALDAPAIIAAAPEAAAFPDDDIVILYRAETIEVTPDSRLTRRIHTLTRLQTQWAMRSRSDVRVAWDSSRQDLEVVTARTFMRDGTVVPTPANGFNEVTPGAVARAADFLNWREMVISHVGTEPGCVVELEYVLRDRTPGPLPPSGVTWFGTEHPVLESRFLASGVETRMVHADDVEWDDEGANWAMWNLPPYRAEGPAALRHRFVPHVVWGRLEGPAALATALHRYHKATGTVGAGLADWLAEARRDPAVLTDADLVQRIADLIHDGTAGVTPPAGPWAAVPRQAEDVHASAIGTAWERAIMALALLREAGWQPEVGVFGQAPLADDQLVAADRFDHLRVVVRLGDENWWLAPDRAEAWTGNADLAGWTGLFITADGGQRVYTVPARAGSCRWSAHLGPAADGSWTATADLVLGGPYRPRGQDARELADRLAGRLLPDGEVTDVDVREDSAQTLSIRFTATAASGGEIDADLLVRELPWPDTGVLAHLPPGFHPERSQRATPLWISTPGTEVVTLKIDLPETWHLETPPVGERSETAPASSFHQSTTLEGRTLVITRTLTMDADEILPADYAAFRDVITAAQSATTTPLIILTD